MVRTKKQAIAAQRSAKADRLAISQHNVASTTATIPSNIAPQILSTTTTQQQQQQQQLGSDDITRTQNDRDYKCRQILAVYDNVSYHEAEVMLMDCGNDENQVLSRLANRPDYLEGIRRIIFTPVPSAEQPHEAAVGGNQAESPLTEANTATQQQQEAALISSSIPSVLPQQLPTHIATATAPPPPPSMHPPPPPAAMLVPPTAPPPPLLPAIYPSEPSTPIPSPSTRVSNNSSKKRTRAIGRLALDDALKQVQERSDRSAFEGWSQARIRAYQMIDQNPNSYYYRFNAPGEEQRKGPWTPEERALFFKRLQEVGANGQWGIFSTAIPGRVGYQCSNFYRLLIETRQIHDPNYVLDEKGKAHFLFDKKSSDGRVEKTFRTHSPHKFASLSLNSSSGSEEGEMLPPKRKKGRPRKVQPDDGDASGTFSLHTKSSTPKRVTRSSTRAAAATAAGTK